MPGGADGFDGESLLCSLMESLPAAVYRAASDSAWTRQRVSGEIEEITGYPAEDFVDATKLESITHQEDAETVREAIAAAIEAQQPWVLEYAAASSASVQVRRD